MKFIDNYLNSSTMYRLMLYGLLTVAGYAIVLGFLGVLQIDGFSLVASLATFMAVCYGTNKLFAYIFGATPNHESALITALILFFLFLPPQTFTAGAILALVGAIAMASKYVLAPYKRHVFNPAAIAAVIAGLAGLTFAGWWIATAAMLPAGAILGLLVLRKTHRFTMFFVFLVMALTTIFVTSQGDGRDPLTILTDSIVSWPLLFMGAIMLTEPITTPPTKKLQLIYGALAGVLVGSRLHVGDIYMTPELALVLANIFSYAVSQRRRVTLTLAGKKEMAPGIFEFSFKPSAHLPHDAGQYADVTLPLKRSDLRGNRRTFTIASSPGDDMVRFGIKMNTPPSAFKKRLAELSEGGKLFTNHVAGDFVLPSDPQQKVGFVAGGIGITPFASIVRHLLDTNAKRDIVFFYQVAAQEQIVYRDLLKEAEKAGVKTVFVVTEKTPVDLQDPTYEYGYITQEVLTKHASEVNSRAFYVSGPPAMVQNYTKLLRSMRVKRVITDYFPGY